MHSQTAHDRDSVSAPDSGDKSDITLTNYDASYLLHFILTSSSGNIKYPSPPLTGPQRMDYQLDTLEHDNLGSTVYQLLCKALIQGRLQPGARLKIRELAEQLGTSVTPVRDAILKRQLGNFLLESRSNHARHESEFDGVGSRAIWKQ